MQLAILFAAVAAIITEVTASPTNPPQSLTRRQTKDFCAGKTSGSFWHPWDCNLYITCSASGAKVQSCEGENLWNSVSKKCGLPGYTDCLYATTCQSQTGIVPAGKVPDIFSTGCNKYAVCDGKSAYGEVLECPKGEMFDGKSGVCGKAGSCATP
ncbi:hypothetical protein BT63DRAFT_417437 [Microthyrium microscopicum]|uniref:Chitin-binding type-2 domain-containing protein n=1 Tax=Microthyrium microscopicum TaxID=703497 RepID=A0A6A6TZY2_9PEZI|nr:hypothetical protein BT63DRAFT_417437 [Microthyrium microscopicum]